MLYQSVINYKLKTNEILINIDFAINSNYSFYVFNK